MVGQDVAVVAPSYQAGGPSTPHSVGAATQPNVRYQYGRVERLLPGTSEVAVHTGVLERTRYDQAKVHIFLESASLSSGGAESGAGAANQTELDEECNACTSTAEGGGSHSEELLFSPDGGSLLVGGTMFPSGSKMPSSIVTGNGHIAEWSRQAAHRLWSASGQIVRLWSTRAQKNWRQTNYTILDGSTVTALSESSDCKVVAVGVTIDLTMDAPDARSVVFPHRAPSYFCLLSCCWHHPIRHS